MLSLSRSIKTCNPFLSSSLHIIKSFIISPCFHFFTFNAPYPKVNPLEGSAFPTVSLVFVDRLATSSILINVFCLLFSVITLQCILSPYIHGSTSISFGSVARLFFLLSGHLTYLNSDVITSLCIEKGP